MTYSQNGGQTVLAGREAIVKDWLEGSTSPIEPGRPPTSPWPSRTRSTSGVGSTRYFGEDGARDDFSNIFVCRFDDDGRCSEFSEWWMRAPSPVERLED